MRRSAVLLFVLFVVGVLSHAPLVSLPYFWDEAGFYIPAAHDLCTTGSMIPTSTLLTAHPPLPAIYLALWWKVFGYAPAVTRIAMLLVAAFALLQVFLLSERLTNPRVAAATTLLAAAYPVIFAQSSLAHWDLPAIALSLWGLRLYLEWPEPWKIAVAFSLAVLAKETAVLFPTTLLLWNLARSQERSLKMLIALATPALPLCAWYLYHWYQTGHVLGDSGFFTYNVSNTLHPLRFLLAAVQRLWQVFGHMNLWVLTLLMLAAMLLPPLRDGDGERQRISISTQLLFLALIATHIVFHSLIGGALLSRYVMALIPLVILVAVSTLRRRVRAWPALVAFVTFTFVIGWFVNPPYRFAPEDNLNYSDFVRIHQRGVAELGARYRSARILTAWPASDELTRPYLGYSPQPMKVVRVDNFSYEQVMVAKQSGAYDIAFVFSTKYEPPRKLFTWKFWEDSNYRFFDYHRDLPPEVIAEMLGGKIVWREEKNGQWAAIIDMQRAQNAQLRPSQLICARGGRSLKTSFR